MKRLYFSPIGDPPTALKKARLDNVVLVPASLLPLKGIYQPLANRLPTGSVLCVQMESTRQKRILESVVLFFRKHGRQVITLPVEHITRNVGYNIFDSFSCACTLAGWRSHYDCTTIDGQPHLEKWF
jgi:hypothetical protein